MWPIVTCVSFCDCFRVCPRLLRYGASLDFLEFAQFWRSAIVQVRNHLKIWNDITNQIIGLLADACMAWISTGKGLLEMGHIGIVILEMMWQGDLFLHSLKRCRCTNDTLCRHTRSKICSVTEHSSVHLWQIGLRQIRYEIHLWCMMHLSISLQYCADNS